MKRFSTFNLNLASALILFASARTEADSDPCQSARKALDAFLDQLPKSCHRASECEGYYYRADSCSSAVLLAKPGVNKGSAEETHLLELQKSTRKACENELAKHGPCAPIPFTAYCRQGNCSDKLLAVLPPSVVSSPTAENQPTSNRSLPFASIQSQCAPWDGPAIGIILSAHETRCGEQTYPSLKVSINRDLPSHAPKLYNLKPGLDAVVASYCPVQDECQVIQSGTLKFESYRAGKNASGSYNLIAPDGKIFKGTFRASWCVNKMLCG